MSEKSTARHLLDFGIIGLFSALFIGTGYWLRVVLIYLVFRALTSEIGLKCIRCLPRDISGIILLTKLKWKIRVAFNRDEPLNYYFQHWVKTTPNKPCIVEIETGREFTFKEINELANKYANHFSKNGFKKGEIVALFLENSADFYALWNGFSKLGIVTAWINSNLKLEPLAHSINVAECSAVITSKSLYPALKSAIDHKLFKKPLKIYSVDSLNDAQSSVIDLSDLLTDTSEPAPSGVTFKDILCYIYTSGTTGHPKAAIIKHYKYFFVTLAAGHAFGITNNDRIYVTMPLYHSAAGIIGIGQLILRGCTVVVRKKFSASNFWKDCLKYECTVSQYIGEICRYLLAQPPIPEEKQHKMRMMYGNGLRAQIWPEFVKRFGIKKIGEFYGSTEGNSNIINIDNKVGSCGFLPVYPGIYRLYPVRLVKVDPETGELVRDKNGLCVSCLPGDTGEMVGTIKQNDPLLKFEGYANKDDTKKKIITDVFRKGDIVFSSGDILYWDELGYLYFKDRRDGAERMSQRPKSNPFFNQFLKLKMRLFMELKLRIEKVEQGMIAAVLAPNKNAEKLLDQLSTRLPEHLANYAIPVFLRICKEVDRTGTFKLKKTSLQKDGFDPDKCNGDLLYYWETSERRYLPLDRKMYNEIQEGVYTKI
ncbi:Protein CBR-ACS-22 [Aphelenchoides bicaudatus]|nr:Protein CBR-ACS-22 [Aphelenchoides bicaudatus]